MEVTGLARSCGTGVALVASDEPRASVWENTLTERTKASGPSSRDTRESGPIKVAGWRGRLVVLDENEASRAFVCAALDSAGYEAVPVATTIGLRKALETERPTVVVCDVSPPYTYRQIVTGNAAVRAVTLGRAPVVLCGTQPSEQLAILVRACEAVGYVERRTDPAILLQQIRRLLSTSRASVPAESLDEIGSSRPAQPQWKITKLLLIDDSEITLELMQERLRGSGFDVRIALSLGEVQSIIQGWSPNVIVADVNMPDMRGDDLCARLKAAAATRDAVVILCSSMPEARLAEVAEAARADAFVSKGVGLEQFLSAIERACGRISNPVVSFG
jgi:CheY-like chemotaxis protein